MKLNLFDRLGDWNPQMLRELKGRLKPSNLLIAAAISLVGQFFLLLLSQTQLPTTIHSKSDTQSRYCTGRLEYEYLPKCLQDGLGNFVINWQLWWLDLFLGVSLIGIFTLLVAGTYLLINDLAYEERQGTLNFIRLSPQSPESILIGKLLGVPILLYLVAVLAVPFHLWAGLVAQIPLILILGFYGVLIVSCFFFYSAALLFSLVSSWLGGFQAWLGSGGVLMLLVIVVNKPIYRDHGDWLNLFSPTSILQYLIAATGIDSKLLFSSFNIQDLQWFYLPVGVGTLSVVSSLLLNYGLWTYWSWQALKRRFPNPSKTMLSKQQSYWLVVCFEVVTMGFALPARVYDARNSSFYLVFAAIFNLVLFLSLILVLTPGRQALQEWTRSRRRQKISSRKQFWSKSLVQDLIWGEKSPAFVALALNLAIAYTTLVPWIVFGLQQDVKIPVLLGLVISFNLTLIYAALTQLILLMRVQKQELWVIGTLGALTGLPLVILGLVSFDPTKILGLWLFTPFAGAAIQYASTVTVFLVLLGQWSILTLLTLQMTRQIRRVGESASKALFVTVGR